MVYTISQLREENVGTVRYKDMLAFIALTSKAIINSVETTINAWEKRGYWNKADQFHEKWNWIFIFFESLIEIIHDENWNSLSSLLVSIKKHTNSINLPEKKSYGEPWIGAYNKMKYI